MFWENKDSSWNVSLLAFQPSDAAASLRKSFLYLDSMKAPDVFNIWSIHSWKYMPQLWWHVFRQRSNNVIEVLLVHGVTSYKMVIWMLALVTGYNYLNNCLRSYYSDQSASAVICSNYLPLLLVIQVLHSTHCYLYTTLTSKKTSKKSTHVPKNKGISRSDIPISCLQSRSLGVLPTFWNSWAADLNLCLMCIVHIMLHNPGEQKQRHITGDLY